MATEPTKKTKRKRQILWLIVPLFVFLTILTVGFVVLPYTSDTRNIMTVYQQEGKKAFGRTNKLDIFNNPKYAGDKVITPLSTGTYIFEVHNNSGSYELPYSIKLTEKNEGEIPMVFALAKNGTYIFGAEGADNMLPLSEFSIEDALLSGDKFDIYTLKWAWDPSDTETNYADYTYTLHITATGDIQSIDVKNDGLTIFIYIAIILILVWFIIMLVLWFIRRRRNGNGKKNNSTNA